MEMSRRTADFVCLLVAMIWGGGFIATAGALETFGPFWVLMLRFSGAAILSLVMLKLQQIAITRSMLVKGGVAGFFMYVAFAFQTFGLQQTDTGMNSFLTSVNVVLVPYFAAVCLHQKLRGNNLVASLVCLAGIGCLSLSSGQFMLRWGDLLSLVCAVFFAAQITALAWAADEDAAGINCVQMMAAALLSIPFALTMESAPETVSMSGVWAIGYSIFISTWLAFWMQTAAQKYTDASSASLLLGTESLWANIFGFLMLHEAKSPVMLLGGGLILLSVFLAEYRSS